MTPPRYTLSPQQIMYIAAATFDVDPITLYGVRTRQHPYVQVRQVVAYVLRHNTTLPFKKIGAMMGGMDHATIIHAQKCVGNLDFDPLMKEVFDRLDTAWRWAEKNSLDRLKLTDENQMSEVDQLRAENTRLKAKIEFMVQQYLMTDERYDPA
jgi:hypothetical protein